ncbi:hypothetical protein L249_2314 [Ophiocordyceps polyrhachis-furcata BCC 54312]|uniref:Uncharacterized protein n=1 Tax=Ophiocordyceps polyrhachis-furcata BCC 54312 TaxID=1330021 RepID=A0A367LNL9_9HYPO|nr:hypothetical protein L249_2314 [Ophiocordyceps polyrhachis-furcata BCC 54312]
MEFLSVITRTLTFHTKGARVSLARPLPIKGVSPEPTDHVMPFTRTMMARMNRHRLLITMEAKFVMGVVDGWGYPTLIAKHLNRQPSDRAVGFSIPHANHDRSALRPPPSVPHTFFFHLGIIRNAVSPRLPTPFDFQESSVGSFLFFLFFLTPFHPSPPSQFAPLSPPSDGAHRENKTRTQRARIRLYVGWRLIVESLT